MNTPFFIIASYLLAAATAPQTFPGWQALRVIDLEGNPVRAFPADLNADGRDELILINTRNSRIDLYRWKLPANRTAPKPPQPGEPNALPMAPEFERINIPLQQLPADAAWVTLQDKPALAVLVSSPDRVLLLSPDAADLLHWTKTAQYDLLPGSVTPTHRLLLPIKRTDGDTELLISFDQGIQRLTLAPGSRADWLKPRVSEDRAGWWLADLDGDGDDDLIETTRRGAQAARWYEREGDTFLPSQVLHDKAVNDMTLLPPHGDRPTALALLDNIDQGLVRVYTLDHDEPNPLGKRLAFPLGGSGQVVFTGMQLGKRRTLVTRDNAQPRLIVTDLTDTGWVVAGDYPSIANVRDMASVASEPGTLLLWARDAEQLYVSRWQNNRLTFPQPLVTSGEGEGERRIVGLGVAGDITWWAQRIGKDIDLYRDAPGSDPVPTRFKDLGEKVDQVVWIGGERIIYKEAFGRALHLATPDGTSQPGDLARAKIESFRLVPFEGQLRPARFDDGVVQWLDDNLHAIDQVMLPEGRQLASLVTTDEGKVWALQVGGEFAHRLEPDDAGILRVADSVRLPGGSALLRDPVLGLLLIAGDRLYSVAPGRPRKLTLMQSLDSDAGRPEGVRDAAIHRIGRADIDGDGYVELLLHDDQRHQITAIGADDELTPMLSWPVFEDRAYPYGYPQENRVAQPRLVFALDADGDGHRDLAMLCHDRLLIYLAREEAQ